ncbi:MAG: hypothetical protein HZA90_17060 [Verrucomicrobia bacterium]|nr:hypothetical protein [Verrucomicrobiota bacterium]
MGLLIVGSTVVAKPRPPQPPWPSSGQIYHEGFDQPYQMPTNQMIDSSVWSESWSGWALERSSRHSRVAPWAVPMLAANGSWNLDPQRGAFRLWYRPEYTSGKGPGHQARLLTLVSVKGKASATWWTLAVSADGACLQLLCETENGPAACASAPVNFQAGSWHLLTLGYTETNCALFIDDQEATVGPGLLTVPVEAAPFTSLLIGSGLSGEVAAGQIDDFAAFTGRSRSRREPASPFGLDVLREVQACWARLSPVAQLGPITPEEEAATRERALAQRAARLAAEQATAESLAATGSMQTFGGGGPDYPEPGETNGLWFLPPLILNTNIVLTLYNADTNKAYEIYYTSVLLNSNTVWSSLAMTGRLGQITFTNPMTEPVRFYRAAEGSDWDGDTIPNWADADPRSTNLGALTITIESPAHGGNFN